MSQLPTGTVSLLFSDIEGSTVLLSRLGAAYAEALDGQRRVLRKAWAEHDGTELGTEGDSFFVVFPTAEGAVAAAAQAQRELAAFEWPSGQQVRVRMGIHTGTPVVHDGGYVGMDVHRAARIAGAAHGGQVVLSEATAKLLSGCLPKQVGLRDLGSHQLKDIASPERLFQLIIGGLRSDFAPLKTLGASSSLPRPATPLVGRDGELAELQALLGSPEVRLATLTGPGGSGKTRLAIAVAHELVESFPDGVYFVSLAAVTDADVMWTSIAEVLDVPPEARTPPELFTHVAHRGALFVLDNLEQVADADDVLAQLLDHAPKVVVLTTSRRALSVPGEHVHPVPPLELPDSDHPDKAGNSGAVQLFVQHARMVRPSFALSASNSGDVTAICRRLDGLPLAIELAAARTRLLSPTALLARLDTALDIAATGKQGPSRQKTLRDTIAWSYGLLNPTQQVFFRRLGVFAGGADLDAITAVTTGILDHADPLDLVGELVDASLATISEGLDGEPRVAMLQTIRAFAVEQLCEGDELSGAQLSHAKYYVTLTEQLRTGFLSGSANQVMAARSQFEVEQDNIREALNWALPKAGRIEELGQREMGVQLCAQLCELWFGAGYVLELKQWLETAIHLAPQEDNPDLARCLTGLARCRYDQGDYQKGRDIAETAAAMWRRLLDKGWLSQTLVLLALCQEALDDHRSARLVFDEAVNLAHELGDQARLGNALFHLANLEFKELNYERAQEHLDTVVTISQQQGNEREVLRARHNIACIMRLTGRVDAAHELMAAQIPALLRLGNAGTLVQCAEDYAAVLADLDDHRHAVQLLGAAEAERERCQTARDPDHQAEIGEAIARTHTGMSRETWEAEYQFGRTMTPSDALHKAHDATKTVPSNDRG